MNKTFGQLLKDIRRERGISQRELAEKVGVDFSYISKVENDRLPPPAADTIVRFCQVLNVPSEVLLSHSGRLSADITQAISASPEAMRFLNEAKNLGLTEDEWRKLTTNLKRLR